MTQHTDTFSIEDMLAQLAGDFGHLGSVRLGATSIIRREIEKRDERIESLESVLRELLRLWDGNDLAPHPAADGYPIGRAFMQARELLNTSKEG